METEPHRFRPAFAIFKVSGDSIRRWASGTAGFEVDWAITIVRVYWSKEVADAEAERLNALNADADVRYFSQHTRVEAESS